MNDIPPRNFQPCPYCPLEEKGLHTPCQWEKQFPVPHCSLKTRPHTTAPKTPETQYAVCPREELEAAITGRAIVPLYPAPPDEEHVSAEGRDDS